MRYQVFTVIILIGSLLSTTVSGEEYVDDNRFNEIIDDEIAMNPPEGSLNTGLSGIFIENRGQWDPRIEFMGSTDLGRIAICGDSVMFDISDHGGIDSEGIRGHVLRYSFPGSHQIQPVGKDPAPTTFNYFIGNDPDKWVTNVHSYNEVIIGDLWDGIDMRYYFTDHLKYDLILDPGSDPGDIGISVEGIEGIDVNEKEIQIRASPDLTISDRDLLVYYGDDPSDTIDTSFRSIDDNEYSFSMDDYDRNREIIIDPVIYASYIGGENGDDIGFDMDIDQQGNVYITGNTRSDDFPVTTGAYDTTPNNDTYPLDAEGDCYAMKLNGTDYSIEYCTYIGGEYLDNGTEIRTNPSGEVYLSGYTRSSDFPTTSNAFNRSFTTGICPFVVRLNDDGSDLLFSTFIARGFIYDMVLDEDQNVICVGTSVTSDFPVTDDAYFKTPSEHNPYGYGGWGVLFKLKYDGSELIYSTYLGGVKGSGVRLTENGDMIILGYTYNESALTTDGAYDRTFNNGSVEVPDSNDFYIMRLAKNGTEIIYATYLGGYHSDYITYPNAEGYRYPPSLDVDDNECAVISWKVGPFYHVISDFPRTEGSYQIESKGLFVVKLNNNGTDLIFSTFIGDATPTDITLDNHGNIYLIGSASSSYPFTDDAWSHRSGGKFLTVLDSSGSLLFSSCFVSNYAVSSLVSIHVDNNRSIFLVGSDYGGGYCMGYNGSKFKDYALKDIIFIKLKPINGTTPWNISYMLGDEYVDIDWDEPDDVYINVTGYRIKRGTEPFKEEKIADIGKLTHFNDTSVENGNTYHYLIIIMNGTNESKYLRRFVVEDTAAPILLSDNTPTTGENGNNLTFSMKVTDNVKVSLLSVSYRYKQWDGRWVWDLAEIEKPINGYWNSTIKVPHNASSPLNYQIHAVDPSDNFLRTTWKNIALLNSTDNIKPTFGEDHTTSAANVSENITISVEVWDNFRLETVWVEYWYNNGSHTNASMSKGSGKLWEYNLTISNVTGKLFYILHANDTLNNWNRSQTGNVTIIGADFPFGSLSVPSIGNTGGVYRIEIMGMAFDFISEVMVEFGFGSVSGRPIKMNLTNGTYWTSINIPYYSIRPLSYKITFIFISGEMYSYSRLVQILDSVSPRVYRPSNMTITEGSEIFIPIDTFDNIGISRLEIVGAPLILVDKNITGSISVPGLYEITIIAWDEAGNTDSTSFMITVLEEDSQSPPGDDNYYLVFLIAFIIMIAIMLILIVVITTLSKRRSYRSLRTPCPTLLQARL
ncbi:MAG: SBBP repeat-containing protein [Thermoplasmatota archaeon]